jgi:hypothetical protein
MEPVGSYGILKRDLAHASPQLARLRAKFAVHTSHQRKCPILNTCEYARCRVCEHLTKRVSGNEHVFAGQVCDKAHVFSSAYTSKHLKPSCSMYMNLHIRMRPDSSAWLYLDTFRHTCARDEQTLASDMLQHTQRRVYELIDMRVYIDRCVGTTDRSIRMCSQSCQLFGTFVDTFLNGNACSGIAFSNHK